MVRKILTSILAFVALFGGGVALLLWAVAMLFNDAPNPDPSFTFQRDLLLIGGGISLASGIISLSYVRAKKLQTVALVLASVGFGIGVVIILFVASLLKGAVAR